MEILNKDELYSIAVYLDLEDLFNFCLTCKRIYNLVYMKDHIWNLMLKSFENVGEFEAIENFKNSKEKYKTLYLLDKLRNKLHLNESLEKVYSRKRIQSERILLEEIPKELTILKNLKHLFLPKNCITIIDLNLPNLNTLDLGRNSIRKIPLSITKLQNLKSLTLNQNRITSLKNITKLSNLKILILNSNLVRCFPKEIANLVNLEQLSLVNNGIKWIPQELCQLKKLRSLNLAFNSISEIPEYFSCLKNLQNFYIYHNQLTVLPDCLRKMTRLERIDITSNKVKDIPDFIIDLPNLNVFEYNHNF